MSEPVQATVVVRATYTATDGSMPESIEVTWEYMPAVPGIDGITRVIDSLIHAPSQRWEAPGT